MRGRRQVSVYNSPLFWCTIVAFVRTVRGYFGARRRERLQLTVQQSFRICAYDGKGI